MKVKIILIILITLCLFPTTIYGNQEVIINLEVHKITINCSADAKIKYNNQIYEKTHDFFIKNGGALCLEIIPINEDEVSTIICNGNADVTVDSNILKISNIYGNMNVDIVIDGKSDIFAKVEKFLENLTSNKVENVYEDDENIETNLTCSQKTITQLNDIENIKLSFILDEAISKKVEDIDKNRFDKLYVDETLNGRCLYEHYFIQYK